ncbi:helix-turn-helix domain-containing protein [Ruegeria arenilitoris]|uniref:helix-turn-helix domain-containing protein n=1 Tax=Ruegeria arenilitoris TaxID=1173585 RepID=UPI0034640D48
MGEVKMDTQKKPRGRPKSLFKESSAGTMQSLDRALGVLTALARRERAALSDLAREVDVPTATTHRILTTLQKARVRHLRWRATGMDDRDRGLSDRCFFPASQQCYRDRPSDPATSDAG